MLMLFFQYHEHQCTELNGNKVIQVCNKGWVNDDNICPFNSLNTVLCKCFTLQQWPTRSSWHLYYWIHVFIYSFAQYCIWTVIGCNFFPIKALEDEFYFVWMKCSCLILMHSQCMSKNHLQLKSYFLKMVKYLHSIFDGLNVQTCISFPVVLWVRSRSCLLDV